jgi:hypothetical protein
MGGKQKVRKLQVSRRKELRKNSLAQLAVVGHHAPGRENSSCEIPPVSSSIFLIASRISSSNWRAVLRIHDLAKNIGFKPFFYRTLHDEINLAAKEIFKIELAVHVMVERFLSFLKRHEHVNVAVWPLLSTDIRAEYADRRNTEPLFISGSCSRRRVKGSILIFSCMNGLTKNVWVEWVSGADSLPDTGDLRNGARNEKRSGFSLILMRPGNLPRLL